MTAQRQEAAPPDVEGLLRTGSAPVLRYLLARLDTPAQAEELTQETLVRAVAALHRGARPAHPVPWLLGIARHVLLETWRGERARRRLWERLAHMAGPSWEGVWEGAMRDESIGLGWGAGWAPGWESGVEWRLVVGEALNGLPEELRAPVLLHYFADLPVAQVATHLGTTPGAVKMRLLRARLALRARLNDEREREDVDVTGIETGDTTTARPTAGTAAHRTGATGRRGAARATPLARHGPVYGSLTVGLEVGGQRYAIEPLSEPAFSGQSLSLEELRWATDRLHAVRLAGPRPLAPHIGFWAAPDPFEHPQPAAVWALLREAETAPAEFALIPTDGWRLGTDPHWRTLLEDLQRAGLRHVWLTFAGLETTHDSLCGRPSAFAAAVRSLERARAVGLDGGANLIVSTRSVGELAELTQLVYAFRADPAGLRGVAVYVPHWSAITPAYEPLRPAPEDLANLPPRDLAPLWRREDFWDDTPAWTEGALTRALLEPGTAAAGSPPDATATATSGEADATRRPRSLGLLVTAGMDVLVGLPYAPPMHRVANLRDETPERVHEVLTSLDETWPPPAPPDTELAARYGDLQSRRVYPSLDGLRRKWVHAWRTERNLPWLAP